MRSWLIWIAAGAALVVGLRLTVWRADPVVVRTVGVERGRVEATLANTKAGTVAARRRAKLSPGTSGIVVALEVERGARVSAGDVLLRLDDATQAAQLAQAERALSVARAVNEKACIGAARALRELERNKKLAETSTVVSEDVLDRFASAHDLAVAECQVAAAQIEEALATVELARAELDKTVLRAPFDAIIARVEVELGEWITPSVPLLAAPDAIDAIDPGSLYVSAPMDEVDSARLAVDQPARITVDSHPGRSFPGKIVRVAPFVLDLEQQNRTVEIEVELDDAAFSSTLLPGTSADVEVILEVREAVPRLPAAALLEGERVLVLEDGRLAERTIEGGLRNWDWVEVRGGLAEGARIVTSLDVAGAVAGARAEEDAGETAP